MTDTHVARAKAVLELYFEPERVRAIICVLTAAGLRIEAEPQADDPLDDLVAGFSAALLTKLKAAREKYGYQGEFWRESHWRESLLRKIREHLEKGDPRDVAAALQAAERERTALEDQIVELRKRKRSPEARTEAAEARVKDAEAMLRSIRDAASAALALKGNKAGPEAEREDDDG